MFTDFFYTLRERGVPVTPTSFLTLHKALDRGLIVSLDDFYTSSRSILVKNERYFDLFDRVFAHFFQGAELPEDEGFEVGEIAQALLTEWLQNPAAVSRALGVDESDLAKLTPDELIDYFKERLAEQTGQHHGGSKWIGTGGTSPVGHSGYHPGGMRVGGISRNKSAVKVAMERRYKDYAMEGPLTTSTISEALKRLRNLMPAGPKDRINVDATIYQTMKNAGEIEIVFEKSLRDRLKVILAIDNGGWSMDPYIPVVQTLFTYSRAQFKELQTLFFHNTIYSTLWKDPSRYREPVPLDDFTRYDPETRLILVGDASMAPYELMIVDGSIHIERRSGTPSIDCLRFLSESFPHAVWLNPVAARKWRYTQTIGIIGQLFPMFELSLDGLDQAVAYLMSK